MLYKRHYGGIHLLCVDHKIAKKIIEEVRERVEVYEWLYVGKENFTVGLFLKYNGD